MAIKFYLSHLFQSIGSSYQEYYVEKDSIDSYQVYTFSIIREKKISKVKTMRIWRKKAMCETCPTVQKAYKAMALGLSQSVSLEYRFPMRVPVSLHQAFPLSTSIH